jgi:hypothetical protein
LEVDVQQGNFKILRLLPQVLILFLVEKWILPTRLEIAEIGQQTEGILGVKHPYLTHMKSDSRNLKCYEFSTSFSSHLPFRFPLALKNILPSKFEKILWSNKFLKVPPCRNYFLRKSRWHLLLMRPWALNLDYTTFPFIHFDKL